jgi:hypothetical protein
MIAFVHINKTAGTTLKHILRQSFGAGHCDVRVWPHQSKEEREAGHRVICARDVLRTTKVYSGLQSIAGHLVTSYSDLHTIPGLKYYTFLREPLIRTASHYQFMKKNMKDIEPVEEWIKKDLYRNVQVRKIAGEENANLAIQIIKEYYGFVGLQERFNESLLLMSHWLKDERFDVRYKSRNVARSTKVSNELLENPTTRQLIEDANVEDLKLYRFVLNELYPAQQEAYGQSLSGDLRIFESSDFTEHKSEPVRSKLNRKLYKWFLPLISRGIIPDSGN